MVFQNPYGSLNPRRTIGDQIADGLVILGDGPRASRVRLMQLNTRRDHGYRLRVLAEHERIVDAVEARDEPTALSALRAHLHTSEYILT